MGDRCYLTLTCRKRDAKKFEEIFGYEGEDEDKKGLVTFVDEESNLDLDEFPTDVQYVGYHGEGYDYTGEEFACDGKELHRICTMPPGDPCVPVGPNGVSKRDLKEAKAYFRVASKVRKALGIK